jgi:hypothetical protein
VSTADLRIPAPPRLRPVGAHHPVVLPAALAGGCLLAALATATLTADIGARLAAADPDLARLMRAMAAVKAILVVLAVTALGWRMQRPVAPPFLAAYFALPMVAASALGAMWHSAALGPVSLAMHGAGAVLVLVASRDRQFLPARR